MPHAPDYDPKPSDLTKIATADYVLYAPFDSFAPRLREAAGGKAKTVELNLERPASQIPESQRTEKSPREPTVSA